jgi:hypothetical protein
MQYDGVASASAKRPEPAFMGHDARKRADASINFGQRRSTGETHDAIIPAGLLPPDGRCYVP